MSFWTNLFKRGGERKPTLRTRLSLESLDARLVPDATPITPPPGGPPAQTPAQLNTTLAVDSSLWFFADDGTVGVLNRDADGNVWWYSGTQADGLTNVTLLASWEDPNSPFLGNPAVPAATSPGVVAVAGGMASVPQKPTVQVGVGGLITINININITINVGAPAGIPNAVPRIPDSSNPYPNLPKIGDPLPPTLPKIGDTIPPIKK